METAALGLMLFLGWASQGFASAANLGHLSTRRHLAQEETRLCVWDPEEKLCEVDESFADSLRNAVNALIDDAESCAVHIADGPCEESGCFWSGNECTVVQRFLNDTSEFFECFGVLATFLEIPEMNKMCKTNYAKEGPCDDSDNCSWDDDDDGKCELDILKTFGLDALLSITVKAVFRTVGITSAPLVSLVNTWIGCKLEDDEDSCLPEDGCIWDGEEEDCEIGLDAVRVVLGDTFPVATTTLCLVQKAFLRSDCPSLQSAEDCDAAENCTWDGEIDKCTLTNVALEMEVMEEADAEMVDLEAQCAAAATKKECEKV